jgi:phosphoadenosine phosphosulfate reductase
MSVYLKMMKMINIDTPYKLESGTDYLTHSIELLKLHEPPEGYYLAFSGGKDSIVCYHLCKQAGVKFDAHYMRAMEPPELVYFIRKEYPDVIRHLPKKSFYRMIKDQGIPPLRSMRFCCRILKHGEGQGRTIITGIRKEESKARRKRSEVNQEKHRLMIAPIIEWTTRQVWNFIKQNNFPYCELYDKGWTRIGCIMCPVSSSKRMKQEARMYPKQASAIHRACIRAYDPAIATTWRNGTDMYKWWLSGNDFSTGKKPELFEDIY